ncbi:hypothetical protein A3Q56_05406 [Intoshia linei]|uniref:Inositol polyphosphate-related phosphatase domain-containing protein n=1 Tax=Intoshia linei TaxID=1819745 RepID=A0A177AXY6_9BILA|nr:hypothetical protein A3Q56_05406 [Intoshia linei]
MLGSEYVLYNNYCIGMLYQLIFIRRELIWYCSEAEMDFKSVRFGPKEYKTKGGQATCFQLFGTTFLFVNSHLTPHVKNNEKRLQDYNVISSSLNLPNKIKNRSPYNLGNHNVTSKFDHTIWAGDLNFRMDKDVHELHTKTIIRKDQLLKAIKKKKIFHKFIEGEITFKPTYKYKINTKDFCEDRAPAFTDRILIRSMEKKNSEIILYKSVSSVNSSDHQPVFAIYDIKIYPGRDEVPMNGGKFEHNVWIEAMKRRASGYNEPSRKAVSENHNKVIYSQACSIQ